MKHCQICSPLNIQESTRYEDRKARNSVYYTHRVIRDLGYSSSYYTPGQQCTNKINLLKLNGELCYLRCSMSLNRNIFRYKRRYGIFIKKRNRNILQFSSSIIRARSILFHAIFKSFNLLFSRLASINVKLRSPPLTSSSLTLITLYHSQAHQHRFLSFSVAFDVKSALPETSHRLLSSPSGTEIHPAVRLPCRTIQDRCSNDLEARPFIGGETAPVLNSRVSFSFSHPVRGSEFIDRETQR